jgi:hypothetical protein
MPTKAAKARKTLRARRGRSRFRRGAVYQRGGAPGPDPAADADFMALIDKAIDTVKSAPAGTATTTALTAVSNYVLAIPAGPNKIAYQAYYSFTFQMIRVFTSTTGFPSGLGALESKYRAAIKFAGSIIAPLIEQVRTSANPPNPYVASTTWQATVVFSGTSPKWSVATADNVFTQNMTHMATVAYMTYLHGLRYDFIVDQSDSDYIRRRLIPLGKTFLLSLGIAAQSGRPLPLTINTYGIQIARSATLDNTLMPNPNSIVPSSYPLFNTISSIPASAGFTLTVPTVELRTAASGAPATTSTSGSSSSSSTTAFTASTPVAPSGPASIQDVLNLVSRASDAKVAAAARSFMTSSGTLPGLINNFISQLQ